MPIALLAGYLQTAAHHILGVNDWIHLTQKIKVDLDSFVHRCSVISEKIYLDERSRVDKEHEHLIAKEANVWYKVLQRLADIVFILAAENVFTRPP